MSMADEFIENFPEKYKTILGQGAVNVSGGQKQRISIARALIKEPELLIMDDATSALDVVTESKIRTAFRNYERNMTTIIIAQRITSVMLADKILVMDNGNDGKHNLDRTSMPRIKVAGFGTGHRQVVAESPKSFKKTMIRIWQYFRGEHGKLLGMAFFMLLSSVIGVFVPYIIGKAIDILDAPEIDVNFEILIIIVISMAIAYIVDAALNFL